MSTVAPGVPVDSPAYGGVGAGPGAGAPMMRPPSPRTLHAVIAASQSTATLLAARLRADGFGAGVDAARTAAAARGAVDHDASSSIAVVAGNAKLPRLHRSSSSSSGSASTSAARYASYSELLRAAPPAGQWQKHQQQQQHHHHHRYQQSQLQQQQQRNQQPQPPPQPQRPPVNERQNVYDEGEENGSKAEAGGATPFDPFAYDERLAPAVRRHLSVGSRAGSRANSRRGSRRNSLVLQAQQLQQLEQLHDKQRLQQPQRVQSTSAFLPPDDGGGGGGAGSHEPAAAGNAAMFLSNYASVSFDRVFPVPAAAADDGGRPVAAASAAAAAAAAASQGNGEIDDSEKGAEARTPFSRIGNDGWSVSTRDGYAAFMQRLATDSSSGGRQRRGRGAPAYNRRWAGGGGGNRPTRRALDGAVKALWQELRDLQDSHRGCQRAYTRQGERLARAEKKAAHTAAHERRVLHARLQRALDEVSELRKRVAHLDRVVEAQSAGARLAAHQQHNAAAIHAAAVQMKLEEEEEAERREQAAAAGTVS